MNQDQTVDTSVLEQINGASIRDPLRWTIPISAPARPASACP